MFQVSGVTSSAAWATQGVSKAKAAIHFPAIAFATAIRFRIMSNPWVSLGARRERADHHSLDDPPAASVFRCRIHTAEMRANTLI